MNLKTLIGFSLALSLFSCEKKDDKKTNSDLSARITKQVLHSQWSDAVNSQTLTIKVVDANGAPIANAQVLVGSFQGQPFKNNYLKTDKNGQVLINRNEWTTVAHVTADASNFIRQTLLSQKPGHIIIKMNPSQLRQKAKISGVVTGLPVADGDKNIDFGLIMASLTKADLFNFDISKIISPYGDTLSAMGQEFEVPSNVSIPKQKERYIINITLDKPVYTFLTSSLGTKHLFAAAGRFVFKPVVDELRDGTPFYELINYFNLTGGSLREITAAGPQTTLNFPAQELTFTKKVSVRSPKINGDELFLSLTANEVSGQLVPTGVRKMNSDETAELATVENTPLFLINAIKRQSEFLATTSGGDRITASILPFKTNLDSQLLPLISDPSIAIKDGYFITTPAVKASAQMTRLALTGAVSDVYTETVGDKVISTLVKRWEVLGTDWPNQIALPNWPLAQQNEAPTKHRFEINLIGGLNAKTYELGDELVQASTHVTRSSVDFQ